MNLNYSLRGKSDIASIYYKVTSSGAGVVHRMPYKTDRKLFNTKRQLSNNDNELNTKLLDFRKHMISKLTAYINDGMKLDLNIVKQYHEDYFNPDTDAYTLKQYIKVFRNSRKNKSTLRALKTTESKLKGKPQVKLTDLNYKWMDNFTNSLLAKGYAESSINKNLQMVKQVVKHAIRNDIPARQSCLHFDLLKTDTINHALTEDELESVFELQINDNKKLENARKSFLLLCTLGLRVSDYAKIKTFPIKDGMMHMIQQKTGKAVVLPLHPRTKHFIDEIKIISAQRLNEYVKEVCELAGINEVVTGYVRNQDNRRVLMTLPKWNFICTHSGRRTFATNLFTKVPTSVLRQLTGHSSEQMLLKYLKASPTEAAETLKDLYSSTI